MGNCIEGSEDKGMGNIEKKAVGANANEIDDNQLNQMLGNSGANSLKQKVSLSFECINLANLDRNSKTDAFCVLWQLDGRQPRKIGTTELIKDSLNPVFVTTINMDYFFEEQQQLRVDVYDADDATNLNNLRA